MQGELGAAGKGSVLVDTSATKHMAGSKNYSHFPKGASCCRAQKISFLCTLLGFSAGL